MLRHERIEERIRKGIEAENTPAFRAMVAETRKASEQYRIWLHEGSPETKYLNRDAKIEAFRTWYANRVSALVVAAM